MLGKNIKMGRFSYNASEDIDCYEGVELIIGNFCSIASGLKIYSGTHANIENPKVVSQYPFDVQWGVDYPSGKMGGKVVIGNDVWIGTDVRILEGAVISDGAYIGAGSLVTGFVPPYAFYAGNPAEVKKYRFSEEIINKLLQIKWWHWPADEVKKMTPYMADIDVFLDHIDNIVNNS